jgi:hypothetical protein
MTELAQPLPAGNTETVDVSTFAVPEKHPVSFSELVYAHYEWFRHRGNEAAESRYDKARLAFEHRHGEIVTAYWCSHVESAVALTEKKRFSGRLSSWGFHRETEWATQEAPDVAAELHRCDELAVRANTVLTGVRQRICMQLVIASAAHLLSLVDAHQIKSEPATIDASLARERKAIDDAERYYRNAANGQAQMVYFGGMAVVAIAIAIIAAVWLGITWATPVAALIAGALGAVVSVVQRINNGRFMLEYDVGGPYVAFLGGLRPLIGGTFAIALAFAFDSGLLHLPVAANETTAHRHLALLVISFVAGFSERWAQDTLTSLVPSAPHAPPEK